MKKTALDESVVDLFRRKKFSPIYWAFLGVVCAVATLSFQPWGGEAPLVSRVAATIALPLIGGLVIHLFSLFLVVLWSEGVTRHIVPLAGVVVFLGLTSFLLRDDFGENRWISTFLMSSGAIVVYHAIRFFMSARRR